MDDKIINQLGKIVCERVKKYFDNKSNQEKFEQYYFNKYHKHYKWNKGQKKKTPSQIVS